MDQPSYHLVQANVGMMRAPLHDNMMSGFVRLSSRVDAEAAAATGLYRLTHPARFRRGLYRPRLAQRFALGIRRHAGRFRPQQKATPLRWIVVAAGSIRRLARITSSIGLPPTPFPPSAPSATGWPTLRRTARHPLPSTSRTPPPSPRCSPQAAPIFPPPDLSRLQLLLRQVANPIPQNSPPADRTHTASYIHETSSSEATGSPLLRAGRFSRLAWERGGG